MLTRRLHDLTLPLLGFGAMRLPLLADGSGRVDEAETRKMVAVSYTHLDVYKRQAPGSGGAGPRGPAAR